MKRMTQVLITGATSGIGEYLARALAVLGYSLILTGRNELKLQQLRDELSPHTNVQIWKVDLYKKRKVFQFAIKLKDVGVIINNAAEFGGTNDILNTLVSDIESMIKVNTIAPIILTEAVLEGMIKSGYGRIINISSTGSLGGYGLRTGYALSKAALNSFTKTLAAELNSGVFGRGIDVKAYCLCVGPTLGQRLDKQISDRAESKLTSKEEMRIKFEKIVGRFIEPEEILKKVIRIIAGKGYKKEMVFFKKS